MKYLREHLGDIVLGIALIIAFALVFVSQQPKQQAMGAGGNFNNVRQYLTVNADPYVNHSTGTTTQTNLIYVGSATTTCDRCVFSVEGIDQVDFHFMFLTATTTTLVAGNGIPESGTTSDTVLPFTYCYYYSDSATTTSDNLWFIPTSNCGSWLSSATATSTFNIPITNVNAKYMKIDFSSSTATSTRVGLWAEAELKRGF